MLWQRRAWRVRNNYTRDLIVDTLIHERLRDGLVLVGAGELPAIVRAVHVAQACGRLRANCRLLWLPKHRTATACCRRDCNTLSIW